MSSRKLSLQIWRLQRLSQIQKALRPVDSQGLCLAQAATPSNLKQRRYFSESRDNGSSNNDFTVREFMRKSPNSKETVEIEPDLESKVEAEVLRSEVEQLRKEIKELQDHDPFGPNSELMQTFPVDIREKLLKAMRERNPIKIEDLDIKEDLDDDVFDKLVQQDQPDLQNPLGVKSAISTPSVEISLPEKSQAYVTQFNKCLGRAIEDPSEKIQLALWKSYLRCRTHVSEFVEMLSDEVWDILWSSQSQTSQRSQHLLALAEDVLSSDNLLTAAQWVEYLECLETAGQSQQALERWEEVREVLDADEDTKADSLNLGIRLNAINDLPEEALALTRESSKSIVSPASLISIISSFAKKDSAGSSERAWMLYLRMKSTMGGQLTMENYEEVSTALLTADKPDLALAVFKDMLLSQQNSSSDSLALFKTAHGYLDDLQASKVSEADVNRISLAALTVLPRAFQNKYFYASWIKKLIGLGEIDAAASVVELMYARNVRPDAKHLNGIIGAWMRQGFVTSQQRAEAMAWSMIEQRIQFVKTRAEGMIGKQSDTRVALERPVPAATIESFSILLQHYLNHGLMAKAAHLMEGLEIAEMKPDAFVLNQWLTYHLRRGQPRIVWEKFSMNVANGVRPDLETFACLFDCGKIQYDAYKKMDPQHFPRARVLFYELMKWLSSLTPHGWHQVKDQVSRDLYDQIVRCFCLSHDIRGTICSLHGMKQELDLLPDANTARMILLSVAQHLGAEDIDTLTMGTDAGRQTKARPSRRQRRGQNPKTSLNKVSALLNAVADEKAAKAMSQGIDPESLDDRSKAEAQLEILTEFLIVVLARNVPEGKEKSLRGIQENITQVAESMGLKELDISWTDLKTKI